MNQPEPRWDRLKHMFAAASAVPPDEREAFLRERGVADATLREVLDLLGASPQHDEQPGDPIGPYKLLELLGEGGFGTVWMAEQRAPIQRRVALKVLKTGLDSAQVLARFEQERQALALMQHPHIAQVYDAGTTPRGRPFFVMELVKGVPITEYAARERLSVEQRLRLFVQVCRAVQHAHQKGVVHRDIKPRNVLVVTADGRPLAKVIDFGIAKATAGRLTERTLFTEHRAMVGTLDYMSPEQAEGLLDVDTRADVYSLGALLYELLTGGTPFDASKLLAAGFGEMLRVLREVEPERPSLRVSSKAGAGWVAGGSLGSRDPKMLFGSLRGDLDWVVMKALEKDRGRRYGSADGLAADVERYLAGDAVEAVPPSLGYRVKKFVRRNRGLVSSVAAIVAVALVALLVISGALHDAEAARGDAEAQVARVKAIAEKAVGSFQRATDMDPTGVDIRVTHAADGKPIADRDQHYQLALAMLEELADYGRSASWSNRTNSYAGRISSAFLMAAGRAHAAALAELAQCPEDMRGWEWRYASTTREESSMRLLAQSRVDWALSDDGLRVLCLLSDPPRLLVFDSRTCRLESTHPIPFGTHLSCSGLDDGVFVYGTTEDQEQRVICLHLPTGRIHEIPKGARELPAGNRYVTRQGTHLDLHDIATGTVRAGFDLDMESSECEIQVLPKGRFLVHSRHPYWSTSTGDPDRAMLVDMEDPRKRVAVPGRCWANTKGPLHYGEGNWLFDEDTGEIRRSAWPEAADRVLDYPSGRHALVMFGEGLSSKDRYLVVEVKTGLVTGPVLPLGRNLELDVFLAGRGQHHRCFSGAWEYNPLSLETGEWLGPEPGQPDTASKMTADGLRWVHDRPGGLEISAARPPQIALAHGAGPVLALQPATHRDGLGVRATTRSTDTVFVPDTGVPHRQSPTTPILDATTSGNGQVQLRQLEGGKLLRVGPTATDPSAEVVVDLQCSTLALDYTGANAALVADDRLLHLRLVPGSRPRERARGLSADAAMAIAVHGARIAVGRKDGTIRVYSEPETVHPTDSPAAPAAVTHLCWSPDGSLLLVGTASGTSYLHRSDDLRQVARLEGHLDTVRAAAWSPDGRRVFTCSLDGTVRCWPTDPPALDQVLTPLLTLTEPQISGRPNALLMTPDGERIACGYDDGAIRVWDSVPWSERGKRVPPLFPSSPK